MKRKLFRYFRFKRQYPETDSGPKIALPVASLLLGIAAAIVAMANTPREMVCGFGDAIVLSGANVSFLSAYWRCSRYHIFTALLSTSYLGVVAVPALLAYRGFTLCCTSAALILDYANRGAMLSAVILGLPGLAALPCLLLIAAESMHDAERLFSARFGLRQRTPAQFHWRRACLCFSFLILPALFEQRLLPKWVEILIK